MSLESIIELVLSEAKIKAEAITAEAQRKVDETLSIAMQKAQDLHAKITSDYTKQASRIEQQSKSQSEMAEKLAALSTINEALAKLAEETAKSIATSKEGQDKIYAWIASKKGCSFLIGQEMALALSGIEKEASKVGRVDVSLTGFTIEAKTDKYIDVLDLTNLARRCISDNASDIVAKLTAP